MRTLTAEELQEVLVKHLAWHRGEPGGQRADLRSADLRSADLRSANLRSADLRSANLSSANLSSANLSSANLSSADLSSANLRSANLSSADLRSANLSIADLSSADLSSATKLDASTGLDTGETWGQYLNEVVPQLLQAGGKTVAEIVQAGAWKCHSWENCPMAEAFGVHDLTAVPLFLQPRVSQFVKLFDSGLIPEPVLTAHQEDEQVPS